MFTAIRSISARYLGWTRGATASILAVSCFCLSGSPAQSAEYAKGIYLLGSTTSMAGFVPPPGTYLAEIKYFYSGDASGSAAAGVTLNQLGANIAVESDINVDAKIVIDVPTALWVAPQKVLNGNVGFGVLVPIGWQDISADVSAIANLTLPNGRTFSRGAQFGIDDDTFSFGDPLLTAFLGWHRGNLHWKVAGLLNIPVGVYSENNLANMGFNRWAFDAAASVTWLDPQTGLEISGTAGFTFNGENPDTDYRTGTEFHVEWALMQNFSKSFGVGLVGYHYQQVSGDSGAGARLGDFKGRVTALGPNINYNFAVGKIPVSTSVRYLREFNTKNRLEGDTGFITVTMPFSIPGR